MGCRDRGPQCRQQLLLTYFDEQNPPRCGVCDNCLDAKKTAQAEAAFAALRPQLLALVQREAPTPRQVVATYPPEAADGVKTALRRLVEEKALHLGPDGRLSV